MTKFAPGEKASGKAGAISIGSRYPTGREKSRSWSHWLRGNERDSRGAGRRLITAFHLRSGCGEGQRITVKELRKAMATSVSLRRFGTSPIFVQFSDKQLLASIRSCWASERKAQRRIESYAPIRFDGGVGQSGTSRVVETSGWRPNSKVDAWIPSWSVRPFISK